MSEQPTQKAHIAVGASVFLVGLANLAYAVFRLTEGRDENLPLISAGVIAAALGSIIIARAKSSDGQ